MKRLRVILSLIVLQVLCVAWAQAQSLKGVVRDGKGEPVIGATVLIVGADTPTGTVSDLDGRFVLPLKKVPAVVQVTAVGFRKEEVDVEEATDEEIEISLTEGGEGLDEVVVVGYGTQKKSDLVGSVANVSADKLKTVTTASFDGALAGQTAGLQATPTSGQPGGGISVRIRGGNSVQGGNEPLYVIDGYPVFNSNLSAGTISGSSTNPLADINPQDIESINVLKDASATAIYGSRGANGVVIITTKRGRQGEKSQVVYSGSYGWQQIRKTLDVLNAAEFAALRNDRMYDEDPSKGHYQYLSQAEVDALGEGTDWQKAAFRTAPVQSHNLSVSGGSEKVAYALSLGYYDQQGIIIETGFKRLSLRSNIDAHLTKRFSLGLSLSASRTASDIAPSGIVTALIQMPAVATIYDEDGSYTLRNPFENVFSNPIAALNERTNKSRNYKLLSTIYGEWELVKDLKLKILFGADVSNRKEYSYVPSSIYEGASAEGIASLGSADALSWLNENTLTYDKRIGKKHHFNILAGFTQQENKTERFSTGSKGFVSDKLLYNDLGSGSVVTAPSSHAEGNSLLSWLGRASYDYKQRYYVSASIRADGSSRFGKDSKWGVFPSVGLSWVVNKEAFFESLKKKVTTLKFRVSYGETGNQEIGNYQSLSTLSSVKDIVGDAAAIGFKPDRISNDDLSWETTRQVDLGLDLGFFNDRLVLGFDFYHKKTSDLLLDVEIPETTGFSSSLQNYGEVQNRGFEFSVSSLNVSKDNFSWNTQFNLSLNRNKLLQLGNGADSYISASGMYVNYLVKVGEPLGSFYGAVVDGILQKGQEEQFGALTRTGKAGDIIYRDFNGDNAFAVASDRTIIGNAEPKFIFGLGNTFKVYDFDLNFMFQGSVGAKLVNGNKLSLTLYNGQQNAEKEAVNRWTEDNPSTTTPRAMLDPAPVFSDRLVEDASFLRLKTVALGYTVPKKLYERIGVSGIRLSASATNVFTITDYSGFDPEVTSSDNTTQQGYDNGIYPVARSFSFGATVTF